MRRIEVGGVAWQLFRFVLFSLFLLSPFASFAQDEEETPETDVEIETAPVIVDGETYFLVRGSVSFTAERRAEKIVERIIEAAEAKPRGDLKVETKDSEFGPTIYAEGKLITHVLEADAMFEQTDLPFLARRYSKRITTAIKAYRSARTQTAREQGIVMALVLTGVYAVFVFGVLMFRKYMRRYTSGKIESWSQDLEEQSGQAVSARPFVAMWRLFTTGVITVIIAVATYYYVALVLGGFARTKTLAAVLIDTIASPIFELGRAALNAIPNLLTLVIIFIVTRYLLQILQLIFKNIERGVIKLKGFDRKWAWPTYRLIFIVLVIIAVVISYPYIPGSDTDAFKGISILLGVVVSLGANSVASNMLGGLVVIYKRSINVGDLIKVGEIEGYVERIAFLDTDLRSLKNELISIPNSVLTRDQITNYTRTAGTTGLVLHTSVGIGYDEPRQKVEQLLIEAAIATAGVKEKPRPFVLRRSLNSFDVTYEINLYMLKDSRPIRVYSDLHANILDRFNAAGVQIMTPAYIADPAEPKIAPLPEKPVKKVVKESSEVPGAQSDS